MKLYMPAEAGRYMKQHGVPYFEARKLIDQSTPDHEETCTENGIDFTVRYWNQETLDKLLEAAKS